MQNTLTLRVDDFDQVAERGAFDHLTSLVAPDAVVDVSDLFADE